MKFSSVAQLFQLAFWMAGVIGLFFGTCQLKQRNTQLQQQQQIEETSRTLAAIRQVRTQTFINSLADLTFFGQELMNRANRAIADKKRSDRDKDD